MASSSALILEWAKADLSPFRDTTSPCKHVTGYLSTEEIHEQLLAAIAGGDIEYENSEPLPL